MQDEAKSAAKSAVRWMEIGDENEGQRVDNYLLGKLKGVPKSRVYRILRKGEVRVNKGRIKPDYKLQCGDIVRIPPIRMPQPADVVVPGRGLRELLSNAVLYESADLLVINKPSGLAVHGGSGISLGLIETLRQMRPEQKYLELAHRLDRETSGCIMLAKKRSMLIHLQEQLKNNGIQKRYLALVKGHWPTSRRRVNAALKKNQLRSGERFVCVDDEGKPSVTEFKVIKQYPQATLLEARLLTGRTHQIRVHAQYVGHPLLGDSKYADAECVSLQKSLGLKRLFLHAWRLDLRIPKQNQPLSLEAELPSDLQHVLERCSSVV